MLFTSSLVVFTQRLMENELHHFSSISSNDQNEEAVRHAYKKQLLFHYCLEPFKGSIHPQESFTARKLRNKNVYQVHLPTWDETHKNGVVQLPNISRKESCPALPFPVCTGFGHSQTPSNLAASPPQTFRAQSNSFSKCIGYHVNCGYLLSNVADDPANYRDRAEQLLWKKKHSMHPGFENPFRLECGIQD